MTIEEYLITSSPEAVYLHRKSPGYYIDNIQNIRREKICKYKKNTRMRQKPGINNLKEKKWIIVRTKIRFESQN